MGVNLILFTNRRETSTTGKIIFYSTNFESRIVHTIFSRRKKAYRPFHTIDAYPL